MINPSNLDSVINYLREFNCCSRCVLRFLKIRTDPKLYEDPETSLNAISIEKNREDVPPKRNKGNICRICLNILQDSTIQKFAENIKMTNINEYYYSDFATETIFPKSLMIRNYSMHIFLREKFPEDFSVLDGVDSINKVFKLASAKVISQMISKKFNPQSNLTLSFEVEYEDDDVETQNITQLQHLIKQGKQQESSKNVIMEILDKCDDITFKKFFVVPPDIPNKEPVANINCMAGSIWIGGRYLKFSREMGQTPWIINNKVMSQYNLQDIIFNSIEMVLGCEKNKLTFCASGREDADVRMIGNGRPFYIQINDHRTEHITFQQCREIEKEIFRSKLAAVVKLQNIIRKDLKKIKDGEQKKRKTYYALCQVEADNIENVINTINMYKSEALAIYQKTPLRVLHRRTQAVREKYIYSMEANVALGYSNLIEIKLTTQAGTYVKEFVNSDFLRTQPSLHSILNLPIDVVALDVTYIDLAWPEE